MKFKNNYSITYFATKKFSEKIKMVFKEKTFEIVQYLLN